MSESIILFIFGFALLLKGASILTEAASSLARELGISNFIIGIVVVGIGTSIPELVVTILSNIKGAESIGVGTVVGSNTFNLLFIGGLSALFSGGLALTKGQVWRHMPLNVLVVVITGVLAIGIKEERIVFSLSRLDGVVLLFLFVGWISYLFFVNKYIAYEERERKEKYGIERPGFISIILIASGIIGIVVGGEWVTEGGVTLARAFGVSEAVIGLTVMSIGTSLPELSASVVAAWKRNYGIAMGNIIGSNIFDFLLILGIASAMQPVSFTEKLFADLWITVAAAILVFCILVRRKRYRIGKGGGIVLIGAYALYLWYIAAIR